MTEPTRPTDAELEAGHARLLAADTTMTITPMSDEVYRAQILGRVLRPPRDPEWHSALTFDVPSLHLWTATQTPSETEDEATKVTVRPFNLPFTITHAELEEARVHGIESDAIFKEYYDRIRAAYDRPHGGLEDYFKQAAEWTTDDKEPTR